MIISKRNDILDVFDEMFPDASCELIHDNPFQLLVAVILSAQTTDASVNRITPNLFKKYPDAKTMSQASLKDLEDSIHSIGLFRNKAKNLKNMSTVLYEEYDGEVPNDYKILVSLPGVGRKTANVVLADAFQVPGIAVDTHVERISKRLGFAKKDDTVLQVEKKLQKTIPKKRWIKTHHQMIFFGRYHCKAQRPNCSHCKLIHICKEKNKNIK